MAAMPGLFVSTFLQPSHPHRFGCDRSTTSGPLALRQLLGTRCSALDEESRFAEGPVEPAKPKFNRALHTDLSYIPVDDPAAAPLSGEIKIGRRRGRRPFKKATPAQAIMGSVVGGCWAVLAAKATMLGSDHLQAHPLAHDLPKGLSNSVNQLLVSVVTGVGGFVVLMFGVSSFGLALLAVKLLSSPKPPMQ